MARLRRPMVRPRKKADEKKDAFIRVRVTDDIKQKLEGAATKDGMDLSTFARVAMIEKARRGGTEI
jgi:uncharacterized protein (DUF1778 family)